MPIGFTEMRVKRLPCVRSLSCLFALALQFVLGAQAQQPPLKWIPNPEVQDSREQERWIRGHGSPVQRQLSAADIAPPLPEKIVIVTWNVHGTHGRILDFVSELKAGRITGSPVHHFVLLLQEVVRVGGDIKTFGKGMARSSAIAETDPRLPDVGEVAEALDLSLLYVPSMRNGTERQDRGNAILSTLPQLAASAFELPFRRERRVGIAASIPVALDGSTAMLRVVNIHFDPWMRRRRMYVLGNPRPDQAKGTLKYLADLEASAMILGGDFNVVPGESGAVDILRPWARSTGHEEKRGTFGGRRLDYLLFRFQPGLRGDTMRAESTFGSDHRPLVGSIRRH